MFERFDVDPSLQLDRFRLLVAEGGSPIIVGLLEDLQGPARRFAGADHDVDVDRLPHLDVRRNHDLLDQDLPVVLVVDRHDVDLYAQRLGGLGLLEQVASVLVAVGDHHDPPGGILGESRQGQLDRRAQVGVLRIDRALDAQQIELAGGRGYLDPRLLAEHDDPGQILSAAILGRFTHVAECRLLQIAGHAVGGVEQEHRRQAIGPTNRSAARPGPERSG